MRARSVCVRVCVCVCVCVWMCVCVCEHAVQEQVGGHLACWVCALPSATGWAGG